MNKLTLEKESVRQLVQAYTALSLAWELTKHHVDDPATNQALCALIKTNKLAAELLERVLQNLLPNGLPADPATEAWPDLLM